jgi:enediyne biosynthesis protein E4
MERRAGYEPEFMRNMLQLNNGNLNINDTSLPRFSEIGQLAGISQTDWSWSVLLADFDNDGWNDIHITNGMGKDLINADFVMYRAGSSQDYANPQDRGKVLQEKLADYGSVPLRNYFYKNNGDYTFSSMAEDAGINDLSISNGAAYADFDNDGDLDLVVNNINQEVFFYENKQPGINKNHSISFALLGDSLNKDGLGTKIFLYSNNKIQYSEQSPVRGYLSSVDKRLHFGLSALSNIDSVIVIWPDGKKQILKNIRTDNVFTLRQSDANETWNSSSINSHAIFKDITNETCVDYKHNETFFNDFAFQRLLPQKYSQLGPLISVGDINGDGLEDFFVGGAFNQSGKIFIQKVMGNSPEKIW